MRGSIMRSGGRKGRACSLLHAARRFAVLAGLLPLMAIPAMSGAAAQDASGAAQSPPATNPGNSVVVTGRKPTTEKNAQHFLRRTITLNEGQLDRFKDPVCPQILGVPASVAARIERRIREDAANAQVPVAADKCETNVMAIITKSSDGLMKFMLQNHNSYFECQTDVELHDILRPGVVHSWRNTETYDEDGKLIGSDCASDDPPQIESMSSVIFDPPSQEATHDAVVVMDKSVVLDKSIAQLADYIAMRALTGARPPTKPDKANLADYDGATILTLFDPGVKPPTEMTSMDVGLLAGLYASDPMRRASSQAYDISHYMAGKPIPPPRQ